ncbi:hypothetical protein SAMN04244553_4211 [Nocardia amikacinitolerans]|uniref:Uncharacterized protein n=1 Tax=Nocardia amikacinitolerans TaxID=756689 RepID=A0A285LQR9_9NOCA|nr:hypothetical protein [Nocardia amikacinitolerans]MCP2276778.1 hypothetical protein [Nocardia amikacinitolerans]MCP2294842.1 hypothetical protein [Nocardia amikacinitolerans]SNY87270.1 hypothetical protein SAMN04244553_4211 [Nocardia amikacinitolerans]
MLSTSNMRRGALRVAAAAAMVMIPAAAVAAATAAAEAPTADTVQPAPEGSAPERTDVSRPDHLGNHGFPGRPGHNGSDSRESDSVTSPGARPGHEQQGMPPTTSHTG